MKTKLITSTYSLMAGIALSIPSLHAAIVYTSPAGYSSLGNLANRPIENAIDGSGLSSGGTSGDILSETHDTAHLNAGPYFLGVKGSDLYFDLGSAQTVDTVWIWQYSRTSATSRGIQGFDISFSNDVNWTSLTGGTGDGGASYTSVATVTGFAEVPYIDNTQQIAVQAQSFTSQSGRYIKLANVTNQGDGNYTGFGEIRFGVVPEPSSTALLGLGGLALILRRRK